MDGDGLKFKNTDSLIEALLTLTERTDIPIELVRVCMKESAIRLKMYRARELARVDTINTNWKPWRPWERK